MDKIRYVINHFTQFYFVVCFLVRFITIMYLIEYQMYPVVRLDRTGVIHGIIVISLFFIFGIIYYNRYFSLVSLRSFIVGI